MSSKMSRSEAGLLGAIKSAKINQEARFQRIAKYNENPILCRHCHSPLSYDDFLKKKVFCNHSCRASETNLGVRRHGSPTLLKQCLVCDNKTKSKYCSRKCAARAVQLRAFLKIESGTYEAIDLRVLKIYLSEKRGVKCQICKLTEWMGQPIPLVCDHIDGNALNHSLSNVRLICNNCDALTPTFKGRNKGSGRAKRRLYRQKYKEENGFYY